MSSFSSLRVIAASKAYNRRTVLDEVDLTVCPGEITALIGRSGSGKTVLLRLVAGMEKPDSGRILSGECVLSAPDRHVPPEKRRIGLVFQDFALFPHLNVADNIMFGLRHLSRAVRRDRCEYWIRQFSLSGQRHAWPHHLSGGEQQRVALARALAVEPVAILLDEPFSGLDPLMREHVRQSALSIVHETGVPCLLVTHDPGEALVHADRVVVIHDGRILQCGRPATVYTKPACIDVGRALGPLHAIGQADLPVPWKAELPVVETVYYRPEAIRLDPSSPVRLKLVHWRLAGALMEITLIANGARLHMTASPGDSLAIGDMVPVSLDRRLVFCFDDTGVFSQIAGFGTSGRPGMRS